MLGEPLCNSTNYPDYKPLWAHHSTWVFGSQYFFELFNETTHENYGRAATGPLYPAHKGEVLWTSFELSESHVWTLSMGVKGDKTRTSRVIAHKPYMGMLDRPNIPKVNRTSSWAEPTFANANVNSCWELYGMRDRAHFPSSGSKYDWRTTTSEPNSIKWDTNWNARLEWSNCSGAPNATISERHNATVQDVFWNISTVAASHHNHMNAYERD